MTFFHHLRSSSSKSPGSRSFAGGATHIRAIAAFFLLFLAAVANPTRAFSQSGGAVVYGLTSAGNLIRFHSDTPQTIEGSVAISGLQPGETILGIDYCPCISGFFGIGSTSRVYRIDGTTGVATPAPVGFTDPSGGSILNGPFSLEFNQVTERLRLLYDGRQSYVNPYAGDFAGSYPAPNFAPGDTNFSVSPHLGSTAYSNALVGATTTTFFAIDDKLGVLVRQRTPDNSDLYDADGQIVTVGSLGAPVAAAAGFDILSSGGQDHGFAALQLTGEPGATLYSIDLSTGHASLLGKIGTPETVIDIAINPSGSVGFSASTFEVSRSAGSAVITVNRSGSTAGRVQVNYATSNGSGIADTDYQPTSGTLTFEDSESSKSFSVGLLGAPKSDKTVHLTLDTPTLGASLGISSALLTIRINTISPTPTPVGPLGLSVTFAKKQKSKNLSRKKVVESVSCVLGCVFNSQLIVHQRVVAYVKKHGKRVRTTKTVSTAIATATGALPAGGSATVKLKLNSKGKKYVARNARFSATLHTAAVGQITTLSTSQDLAASFTR